MGGSHLTHARPARSDLCRARLRVTSRLFIIEFLVGTIGCAFLSRPLNFAIIVASAASRALLSALIPNSPSAQMSLLALQLVAVGGVTALKPSRGARRCAVALKPVSMAGAGKKPKDEDNKPPRGFPRCVPGAPPASVRTPRVAIHTPRLARASRRRPGIAKARRPVAVVRFLFRRDRKRTFHAAFARDGRDSHPSTTSLSATRRDATPLG